jgi:dihydrofolate reductase
VSEFSESYHLEADEQQAGIHLLHRANLDGFVFPPQGGWMTILPRSKFGALPDALVQANQGVLLRYLLDEDAGWMFEIFTGPRLGSRYQCRWLDWSDQEGQIRVDASDLDVEVAQALAKRHGHGPRPGRQLERILRPRLERRTDQETGYWGVQSGNPIADALNSRPKYVASNTLTDPQWADTTVLSGDVAAAIRELKAKPGGGLQVHGSGNLIRWLLENELVDEINLLVCPVIVGQGTRLFPDSGPDIALDLVESRAFPKGITLQVYRPAGRPQYATD